MYTDILALFDFTAARKKLSGLHKPIITPSSMASILLHAFRKVGSFMRCYPKIHEAQSFMDGEVLVDVMKSGTPKYYHLTYVDAGCAGEEVKFSVEGYIVQKRLPPLLSTSR